MLSDLEFLGHQGLLGSGYALLVAVEPLVQSGFQLVVLSSDIETELAMLGGYDRNLPKVAPARTANLLRDATEALERHVTDSSGQTLNDYLFTRGLKVSQDFADLSGALGQAINPLNIE
jgi:hypothetical protein